MKLFLTRLVTQGFLVFFKQLCKMMKLTINNKEQKTLLILPWRTVTRKPLKIKNNDALCRITMYFQHMYILSTKKEDCVDLFLNEK